jgi:hypothetical protein
LKGVKAASEMNDDDIQQRISGRRGAGHEHSRRERGDRSLSGIDGQRRDSLAHAGLGAGPTRFLPGNLLCARREGDVQCGALVTKIIERDARCRACTPQQAVAQIVEAQAPRQTGTDRIEAAFNALLADQRRNGSNEPL